MVRQCVYILKLPPTKNWRGILAVAVGWVVKCGCLFYGRSSSDPGLEVNAEVESMARCDTGGAGVVHKSKGPTARKSDGGAFLADVGLTSQAFWNSTARGKNSELHVTLHTSRSGCKNG